MTNEVLKLFSFWVLLWSRGFLYIKYQIELFKFLIRAQAFSISLVFGSPPPPVNIWICGPKSTCHNREIKGQRMERQSEGQSWDHKPVSLPPRRTIVLILRPREAAPRASAEPQESRHSGKVPVLCMLCVFYMQWQLNAAAAAGSSRTKSQFSPNPGQVLMLPAALAGVQSLLGDHDLWSQCEVLKLNRMRALLETPWEIRVSILSAYTLLYWVFF